MAIGMAISVRVGAWYDTAILHNVAHASTRSLKQLKTYPADQQRQSKPEAGKSTCSIYSCQVADDASTW